MRDGLLEFVGVDLDERRAQRELLGILDDGALLRDARAQQHTSTRSASLIGAHWDTRAPGLHVLFFGIF